MRARIPILLTALTMIITLTIIVGCERGELRRRAAVAESEVGEEELPATGPQTVPSEYQALYSQLEEDMDSFIAKVQPQEGKRVSPTAWGVSLLPANSNRGQTLLEDDEAFNLAVVQLEQFRDMGIELIQLDIQFPIFYSGFHQSDAERQQYIDFYQRVVKEIRSRGFKLSVESQVVFTNDFYANLPVADFYDGLSAEEYRKGRLETIQVIARELEPDYLTVANEPNTEFENSKQDSLKSTDRYADFVTYLVEGARSVAPPTTRIGGGLGTWERDYLELAQQYAASPALDFINLHIYPINEGLLDRAIEIADVATQGDKTLVLGEVGLYKIRDDELRSKRGSAGAIDIYARDAYGFWQPLDQKFLEALDLFAHTHRVEYISYFWSGNLFAYLPYEENADNSPRAVQQQMNRAVVQAVQQGESSALGKYFTVLSGEE